MVECQSGSKNEHPYDKSAHALQKKTVLLRGNSSGLPEKDACFLGNLITQMPSC
jgi:hypothetical protein